MGKTSRGCYSPFLFICGSSITQAGLSICTLLVSQSSGTSASYYPKGETSFSPSLCKHQCNEIRFWISPQFAL